MDNLSPEDRRKNMQRIRSKGTNLEQSVSRALWKKGIRFRKNQKDLPGKPDISIKKYKLAVFLDSCFFHGCPKHFNIPKTNTEYWLPKIERNKQRDQEVNQMYLDMGWTVLRFWEHEVKADQEAVLKSILDEVTKNKNA